MVSGGHAWLWGVCVVMGVCVGYDKISSMSGWYASYWNAFLLINKVRSPETCQVATMLFTITFTVDKPLVLVICWYLYWKL